MFGTEFKAQVIDLTKRLEDMSASKMMLEQQLEEARTVIETNATALQTLKKNAKSYEANITNLKAVHVTEMTALAGSVNHKVNSALASVGVTRFANEIFQVSQEVKNMDVLATFNSLTGPAKTEFYAKNKDAIAKLMLGTGVML